MVQNPDGKKPFNPAYQRIISESTIRCGAPAIWLVGSRRRGLGIEMCDICSRMTAFSSASMKPINTNPLNKEVLANLTELITAHRALMRRRNSLSDSELDTLCLLRRRIFSLRWDLVIYVEQSLDSRQDAFLELKKNTPFAAVIAECFGVAPNG